MAINLISSKGNDEERVLYSKSDNIKIKHIKLYKSSFSHFLPDIELHWKH